MRFNKGVFLAGLKRSLWLAAVFYVVLLVSLVVFQDRLIYLGSGTKALPQPPAPLQAVTLSTRDDLNLTAWYQPPAADKPVILFMHGNADSIANRVPMAKAFHMEGYGLLMLEYRGYSGNPGKPSEQGFYNDADAAMDFLEKQGVQDRVAVYAESLGSGAALYLAEKYTLRAVILSAPFPSLPDVAAQHYRIYPVPLVKRVMRHVYPNLERIAQVEEPLLLLHGLKDSIMPVEYSKALYDAAASTVKEYRFYPKGTHINLLQIGGWQDMMVFLQQHADTAQQRP